jgi:hypothetical protein
MGRARHLSAPVGACALASALVALFAAGCGSSESESSSRERTQGATAPPGATARSCTASAQGVGVLRATGVACSTAAGVAGDWVAKSECVAPDASRSSCVVSGYHCLAASTERRLAVSCARSGRSISFVLRE